MSGKVWIIEKRLTPDFDFSYSWDAVYEDHGVFSSKKHAERVAEQLEAEHESNSRLGYENEVRTYQSRHHSWRISDVLYREGLRDRDPGPEPTPPGTFEEWQAERFADPDRKPFYRVVSAKIRRESQEKAACP